MWTRTVGAEGRDDLDARAAAVVLPPMFAPRFAFRLRETTAFIVPSLPFTRLHVASAPRCGRRAMTAVANGTVSGEEPLDIETAPAARWQTYRLPDGEPTSDPGNDWVSPVVADLASLRDWRPAGASIEHPPRILILHGTLRENGFSKALSYECARILDGLGLDVRCFDPHGLPVRDPTIDTHPKVLELRALVHWSEAHVWCAAELHGNLCSVFKNQIDWIPLNTGSVRPTQGKAVAVLQVNGGSQSFNVVNTLRLLARWMRMPCVVNQSSVAMAWKEFDDDGRMKESSMRGRVVDVMEEFVKFARVNREYADVLNDRWSERKQKEEKGRLLTQAESEALKDKAKEKAAKNN